jgi:hypothetical protein
MAKLTIAMRYITTARLFHIIRTQEEYTTAGCVRCNAARAELQRRGY